MKKLLTAAATCITLFVYGQGLAADVELGKKKAAETCASCHGADGNSTNSAYPKLAGQHEDYLVKALTDYKSGARKDPIMAGMAAPLNKQDIANLAAFFASQKSGLTAKY